MTLWLKVDTEVENSIFHLVPTTVQKEKGRTTGWKLKEANRMHINKLIIS